MQWITKNVLATWREDWQSDEEHTLFPHKTEALAIGVHDVAALLVKSDLAIPGQKFVDGDDWAVYLGMLKLEVESISVVIKVHDVDLSQVGRQVSSGGLVTQPPWLVPLMAGWDDLGMISRSQRLLAATLSPALTRPSLAAGPLA